MRGNKKLIQRISKVGATGILACAVSFSLPQIMQTEDTLQIKAYGISGSMFEMSEGELFSDVLSKAVTFGRDDMITVEAAARDSKKSYTDGKIIMIQDSADKADEPSTLMDYENATEEDVKGKANSIKENAQKTPEKEEEEKQDSASKKSEAAKSASQKGTTKKAVAKTSSNEKNDNKDAKEKETAKSKTTKDTKKAVKTESKEKTNTEEKTAAKQKKAEEVKTDTKSAKKATAAKKESSAKTKTDTKLKKSSTAKTAAKATAKTTEQNTASKKWENKLMADVDDRLNIRKSFSEDSEIVGRLCKGDVAKVLKKGKEWTKIKSGSVTGYVKNEYCVFGTKAYKLAKKVCDTYAVVEADGLRIRQKPSEKAKILDEVYEGDKLTVKTTAKGKDGWVVINMDGQNGYVAEEYVNVALGTGRALSIEEEMAQIEAEQRAQDEAAAAENEAEQQAVNASSASAVYSNSQTAESSDLTLLSAIIFCEAGGESYEGQVAVGAVVMNRVNSGSFPNSISGVVYESGQFSPVANGSLSRALANGNYQNCMSAAREALAGSDNTGGAKFFHRVNGDAGLVIGNHVFY